MVLVPLCTGLPDRNCRCEYQPDSGPVRSNSPVIPGPPIPVGWPPGRGANKRHIPHRAISIDERADIVPIMSGQVICPSICLAHRVIGSDKYQT